MHLFHTNAASLDTAHAYINAELGGVIERLVPGGTKDTLLTFRDRTNAMKGAWIVVKASAFPSSSSCATSTVLADRRLTSSRDSVSGDPAARRAGEDLASRLDNDDQLVVVHPGEILMTVYHISSILYSSLLPLGHNTFYPFHVLCGIAKSRLSTLSKAGCSRITPLRNCYREAVMNYNCTWI